MEYSKIFKEEILKHVISANLTKSDIKRHLKDGIYIFTDIDYLFDDTLPEYDYISNYNGEWYFVVACL